MTSKSDSNGKSVVDKPPPSPAPLEEAALSSDDKVAQEQPVHVAKGNADTTNHEYITGVTLLVVISGITLVAFLMLLDTAIVSTAIPQITNEFHSLQDVAWYGSAYTLASCSLQPLTGKIYTHFKLKWVFLGFFGVFELGSLLCGVASSSKMLIVGRAVAGVGTSGTINGAITIIAGAVPMQKRPAMIGVMMGVSQLGLVLGPLIGGAFTTYTTWRWCFYLNLPVGAITAILLTFARVPEQRQKGRATDVLPMFFRTFDLLGFVLFAPAAIMFLLALEYGGQVYSWDSPIVIGLFCGAAAAAVIFLLWEYRVGKDAMIPIHLICQRITYCSFIFVMSSFGLTIVVLFYMPIYFQAVMGDSALISGVNLLPNILCQLVMAVLSGVLTGKLGYYLPWAVLGSVLCAIGSGLLSTISPTASTAAWAGYQALFGLGRGASTQPAMIAVQNSVSPDDISTATAILIFGQSFGGSVFLAVAQVIFSNGLHDTIPEYAPNVSVESVINGGATGYRDLVSAADLPGVLVAYATSINRVFYLVVALSVIQTFASCGLGWRDVRKKDKKVSVGHVEEKGDV
ncbi:hypothetical protein BDW74DRAFT_187093 [Aspergillus multicolor]|uniref:MDR family MFS transporter n=1 Tax=Aspergillus multicolor TaxID=41759 RepID=UPI003CCE37C1